MPRHAIHLGTAWEPPTAEARVWLRRFGRPAGVEPGDRLLLVCERAVAADAWRAATLNEHPLAWREVGPGSYDCDVTALIADRNVLSVPTAQGDPTTTPDATARVALPAAWGRLSLVIVSD